MKKLPIGQQSYENLISRDCIYVDKTAYIHQLMEAGGSNFFLSRPRRFGKSLLLSTIKSIFEGKKFLFKQMYIEDKINWEPHPVLLLDMTKDSNSPEILKRNLADSIDTVAKDFQLDVRYDAESPATMLEQLIARLHRKTGKQVVVLIDEYEKPILDNIHDIEQAEKIREALQTFYSVLKAAAGDLKFLLVTGITKVSQTSIFSGFNNLNDISFDTAYAGICGYTQQELEASFSTYLAQTAAANEETLAETLTRIKYWYDGYSWNAETFVYNPYSVLLLLDKHRFRPFWYSTGTPTFLLKLLKEKDTLERILKGAIRTPETFTEGQRIENLNAVGLLFQAGYLTIREFDRKNGSYFLEIPNEEVRTAIAELTLMDLTQKDLQSLHELAIHIREGFANGDTKRAIESLDSLLANTTFNTHYSNHNESHYQALFQLVMIMANIDHPNSSGISYRNDANS